MIDQELLEERVVLRFLERYVADREQGGPRTLAAYQALFPGHDERIRHEYDALNSAASDVERLGPYRLLRTLGEGGQGVVYLAEDERFGRTVALKVLPRALGVGRGLPTRLAREMEVLSRLDHPGICVVYEAGEQDGHAYLAMRYVPGTSLARMISDVRAGRERGAHLSDSGAARRRITDAVGLVERLSRALHTAHEAGVIHRDVKPANVIVHDSGEPVLLDFGLARAESSAFPTLTRTGDFVGTPHYMSPERLRGQGLNDRRTDVWSLGVTLYELLTGTRPFEGPTLEAVSRRIEHDEPENPRVFDRGITRDLAVVVAKALEKHPARRYATAEAFADDLARVLRGESVRARPVSAPERAVRWARRNPAPAVLLAALLVGLVAALFVARELRGLAEDNAAALRIASAHLARSEFEEARLLALSGEPGRTAKILERVASAVQARETAGDAHELDRAGGDAGARLPTTLELRNLAAQALLTPDAELLATREHDETVAAALSEDGRWMVTRGITAASERILVSSLRLLDVATGDEVARSSDPRLLDAEEGLAVDADGIVALPGPGEVAIELWDLRAERRVAELALPDGLILRDRPANARRMWKLRFSPDGRYVAAACVPHVGFGVAETTRGFAVWDVESGAELASAIGGAHRFAWLAFSPDSEELIAPLDVLSAGVVELDGDPRVRWKLDFDRPVRRAALSLRDDPRVFAVLGEDDAIEDTLVVVREGGVTEHGAGLGCRLGAVSEADLVHRAEDDLLLFGDERRGLRVVRASDGAPMLTIEDAHVREIGALAFAEDGARIVSHGRIGVTRTWAPTLRDELVRALPMPVPPVPPGSAPEPRGDYLVLSRDGEHAAMVAATDTAGVWTWEPGALGATWTRHLMTTEHRSVVAIDVHAGAGGVRAGRTCGEGLTVWDASGAGFDRVADDGARFESGVFRANGDYVALEHRDGALTRVVLPSDAPGDEVRTPIEVDVEVLYAALGPEGRRLLAMTSSDASRPLSVVDVETGAARELELGAPAPAAQRFERFSDSGELVGLILTRSRESLALFRTADGERVVEVPFDGPLDRSCWDVTPDDRLLVTAGRDGRAHLFDVATGERVLTWRAEEHDVRFVEALPGGRVATWSGIGAMHVFELERLRAHLADAGVAW